MRRVVASFVVALSLSVSACGQSATPIGFDPLRTAPGQIIAPLCTADNDGKRFILPGFLQPRASMTSKKGVVDFDFFEKLDANGQGGGASIIVDVIEGKHVKLDIEQSKKAFKGGQMITQSVVGSVTLLTTDCDAKITDKVNLVFDQQVIKHFQTKAITACTLTVAELRK